jgi:hypothetical protein
VLEVEYEKAMELFKINKNNISNLEVYYLNIILTIKYSNIELFNYLMEVGLKKSMLDKK